MKELTHEQIEYALARFVALVERRGLTQTQLEQLSGVPQSTISKVINRPQKDGSDGKKLFLPTVEVLSSLFLALGLKLADVLNEPDAVAQEIIGYLATPLTGVVRDPKADGELVRLVANIKQVAASPEFESPPFDIYWPGDHTHPIKNADFTSNQVYRIDRSRASTFDFVILLCAAPSYGVGQENEIATQSGVPAIRIIPKGISRMMTGSFIKAVDVPYSGTLATEIEFSPDDMSEALKGIRRIYFRHRALYKGMNGDGFGRRFRKLVDERSGNYQQFADELGVDLSYVQTLMEEPFAVSNPSIRLLKRIAVLLQERVSFLIGESEEADPVWVESNLSFRAWVAETEGLDASLAFKIREDWRTGYFEERRLAIKRDHRIKPMAPNDWSRRYREAAKKAVSNGQSRMFG